MKKNITINLYGSLYAIDEDAVDLLEQYLDNMKRYFSQRGKYAADGSGDEIVDDIERRVAELFSELKANGVEAISIEHVQQIIKRIGNPEEWDDTTEGEQAGGPQQPPEPPQPGQDPTNTGKEGLRRKLFRDPDDKLLGGVMSGLCRYFGGTDPLPWRIILVLLSLVSLQTVSIAYLIAWALLPQAKTAEDRLRMQGRPVNPQTLNEELMRTAEQAGDYLRSPQFRDSSRSFLQSVLHFTAMALRMLLLFVAASLMLLLLLFIAVLAISLFGGIGVLTAYGLIDATTAALIEQSPTVMWHTAIAASSAFVCLFIAIYALLRALLRPAHSTPMRMGSKLTLTILFVLSLASAITFGILAAVQMERIGQKAFIERNSPNGYFMLSSDTDRLAELDWELKAYRNCNVGESLFRWTDSFVEDDHSLEYMRFNRGDNRKAMEVQLERAESLPAGRYHLECVAYSKGSGVWAYALPAGSTAPVAAQVPVDDSHGKGNLNALPADSLLHIAFFGEMLQGHERRDNIDDFKEDWSMVRSASFVHPGGELRYGICNQGSLIGTQPSARPARKFGLLDLRVVPDSIG